MEETTWFYLKTLHKDDVVEWTRR